MTSAWASWAAQEPGDLVPCHIPSDDNNLHSLHDVVRDWNSSFLWPADSWNQSSVHSRYCPAMIAAAQSAGRRPVWPRAERMCRRCSCAILCRTSSILEMFPSSQHGIEHISMTGVSSSLLHVKLQELNEEDGDRTNGACWAENRVSAIVENSKAPFQSGADTNEVGLVPSVFSDFSSGRLTKSSCETPLWPK